MGLLLSMTFHHSTSACLRLYQKSNMRSYEATLIRNWTQEYLVTGNLVKYKQGKFIKTCSIIFDEHVQQRFRSELRNMKDEDRTPESFLILLNDHLFAELDNAPTKISLNTAYKWLLFLGFSPTVQRKGYYTDGHCREDVVNYRNDIFLPQMLALERRMAEFTGDDMEIVTEPDFAENEKKVVFIAHDESTFYCCEGKKVMWMENGKIKILPKSNGRFETEE